MKNPRHMNSWLSVALIVAATDVALIVALSVALKNAQITLFPNRSTKDVALIVALTGVAPGLSRNVHES